MFFASCLVLLFSQALRSHDIQISEPAWNQQLETRIVSFKLDPDESLYRDFLLFATDDPHVTVKEWSALQTPFTIYDKQFKDSMSVHTGNVDFKITFFHENDTPASLHVQYRTSHQLQPQEKVFALGIPSVAQPESVPVTATPSAPAAPTTRSFFPERLLLHVHAIKAVVSQFVEKSDSIFLRFIAVFILGVLMSLTPCIYPMIPITVGILQTSTSKSLFKNFLLATIYILGMASTFAVLGLLAARGSAHFGELLGNPYFVIILVLFLLYLAGTMLGLYELYIPRFMQPKQRKVQSSSYISIFLFGAMSGTIASPCLSPGLLLLLSIVATLGNPFFGFMLLFVFGLGLGLPLLIIGTFSSSINLLPRAGLWMMEIKKLFGLMLIGMCFYYLAPIMSATALYITMALTLGLLAFWFIIDIKPYDSSGLKRYKYGMSIVLFALGFFALGKSFFHEPQDHQNARFWLNSYEQAREQALKEHKLLFIDCGALWCSACKEVNHHIIHTKEIEEILPLLVAAYIDCTNPHEASCASLHKKFEIRGLPALLLIDPQNDMVLKRWGSEILDFGAAAFAQELKSFIK